MARQKNKSEYLIHLVELSMYFLQIKKRRPLFEAVYNGLGVTKGDGADLWERGEASGCSTSRFLMLARPRAPRADAIVKWPQGRGTAIGADSRCELGAKVVARRSEVGAGAMISVRFQG